MTPAEQDAEDEQAWRKHVEEVIARLERRAAGGEVYAALCLQGWRQELQRITEGNYDERTDGHAYRDA